MISTKAGYDMWPGPYGEWGSRKYLLASLDQSLRRMGLDYVDIFYSHRPDPHTPLEETMGALDSAVRQGKALYVGISSYAPDATREAAAVLAGLGTPLLIHQPSYSMLNRWIEDGLLEVLGELGVGCIGFSPLAQGLLTDRYAEGSRRLAHRPPSLTARRAAQRADEGEGRGAARDHRCRARSDPAAMALAWTLRDPRMTSTLVGASSVEQLEANVHALERLDFTADELAEIDRYATDSDINIWATEGAAKPGAVPSTSRCPSTVSGFSRTPALLSTSAVGRGAPRAAGSAPRSGPATPHGSRDASARSRARRRVGTRRAGAAPRRGRDLGVRLDVRSPRSSVVTTSSCSRGYTASHRSSWSA